MTSPKEIINVEILHLDDLGYGPKGSYTRRQWREACLTNLLAEKGTFTAWYSDQTKVCTEDSRRVKHGYVVTYFDGSKETVFDFSTQPEYAIDFVGCRFERDIELRGVQFPRSVLFVGATFCGNVNFESVIFARGADFKNAHFLGGVSFTKARFANRADFSDSTFTEIVRFSSAVFGDQANFVITNFQSDAYFDDSKFEANTFFCGSRFNRDAVFAKTVFHSLSHFRSLHDAASKNWARETSFENQADFENAVFKNVGHFERVRFVNQVPSFLGVDNATTRLEFSDNSYFPKQDRTEDAVTRLGHLKRLADEHGQTDQALNFNALELHAKAGLDKTSGFTKLVTWVYGAVSDYGRSFTRPIATYVALLFITLLLSAGHAAFSLPAKACDGASWWILSDLRRTTAPCALAVDDKLHISGYRAAAEYTLYRAAGVLDFSDNGKATDAVARRLFGQPIEPWWMRVWGVFKAIASTALLFLTALGLRNKYRIK